MPMGHPMADQEMTEAGDHAAMGHEMAGMDHDMAGMDHDMAGMDHDMSDPGHGCRNGARDAHQVLHRAAADHPHRCCMRRWA